MRHAAGQGAGLVDPSRSEELAFLALRRVGGRVRSLGGVDLGSDQAALVADDTQVIKKGDRSAGVAPQYCGLIGQTENCQVMPMLTYATEAGHAFIDRELYLPRGLDG